MSIHDNIDRIKEILSEIKDALGNKGISLDGIPLKDWPSAIRSQS